jgi:polyhydroxyalkanoate synthesis regulator protein
MNKAQQPILIKQYAGSRLYRPDAGSYVGFADLVCMIEDGKDFVVRDAATGTDVTQSVLTRILVAQRN